MKITMRSVITDIIRTKDIPVDPDDFQMWKDGILSMEEAMPYLRDEDRQFILSGIVNDEWNHAFRGVAMEEA